MSKHCKSSKAASLAEYVDQARAKQQVLVSQREEAWLYRHAQEHLEEERQVKQTRADMMKRLEEAKKKEELEALNDSENKAEEEQGGDSHEASFAASQKRRRLRDEQLKATYSHCAPKEKSATVPEMLHGLALVHHIVQKSERVTTAGLLGMEEKWAALEEKRAVELRQIGGIDEELLLIEKGFFVPQHEKAEIAAAEKAEQEARDAEFRKAGGSPSTQDGNSPPRANQREGLPELFNYDPETLATQDELERLADAADRSTPGSNRNSPTREAKLDCLTLGTQTFGHVDAEAYGTNVIQQILEMWTFTQSKLTELESAIYTTVEPLKSDVTSLVIWSRRIRAEVMRYFGDVSWLPPLPNPRSITASETQEKKQAEQLRQCWQVLKRSECLIMEQEDRDANLAGIFDKVETGVDATAEMKFVGVQTLPMEDGVYPLARQQHAMIEELLQCVQGNSNRLWAKNFVTNRRPGGVGFYTSTQLQEMMTRDMEQMQEAINEATANPMAHDAKTRGQFVNASVGPNEARVLLHKRIETTPVIQQDRQTGTAKNRMQGLAGWENADSLVIKAWDPEKDRTSSACGPDTPFDPSTMQKGNAKPGEGLQRVKQLEERLADYESDNSSLKKDLLQSVERVGELGPQVASYQVLKVEHKELRQVEEELRAQFVALQESHRDLLQRVDGQADAAIEARKQLAFEQEQLNAEAEELKRIEREQFQLKKTVSRKASQVLGPAHGLGDVDVDEMQMETSVNEGSEGATSPQNTTANSVMASPAGSNFSPKGNRQKLSFAEVVEAVASGETKAAYNSLQENERSLSMSLTKRRESVAKLRKLAGQVGKLPSRDFATQSAPTTSEVAVATYKVFTFPVAVQAEVETKDTSSDPFGAFTRKETGSEAYPFPGVEAEVDATVQTHTMAMLTEPVLFDEGGRDTHAHRDSVKVAEQVSKEEQGFTNNKELLLVREELNDVILEKVVLERQLKDAKRRPRMTSTKAQTQAYQEVRKTQTEDFLWKSLKPTGTDVGTQLRSKLHAPVGECTEAVTFAVQTDPPDRSSIGINAIRPIPSRTYGIQVSPPKASEEVSTQSFPETHDVMLQCESQLALRQRTTQTEIEMVDSQAQHNPVPVQCHRPSSPFTQGSLETLRVDQGIIPKVRKFRSGSRLEGLQPPVLGSLMKLGALSTLVTQLEEGTLPGRESALYSQISKSMMTDPVQGPAVGHQAVQMNSHVEFGRHVAVGSNPLPLVDHTGVQASVETSEDGAMTVASWKGAGGQLPSSSSRHRGGGSGTKDSDLAGLESSQQFRAGLMTGGSNTMRSTIHTRGSRTGTSGGAFNLTAGNTMTRLDQAPLENAVTSTSPINVIPSGLPPMASPISPTSFGGTGTVGTGTGAGLGSVIPITEMYPPNSAEGVGESDVIRFLPPAARKEPLEDEEEDDDVVDELPALQDRYSQEEEDSDRYSHLQNMLPDIHSGSYVSTDVQQSPYHHDQSELPIMDTIQLPRGPSGLTQKTKLNIKGYYTSKASQGERRRAQSMLAMASGKAGAPEDRHASTPTKQKTKKKGSAPLSQSAPRAAKATSVPEEPPAPPLLLQRTEIHGGWATELATKSRYADDAFLPKHAGGTGGAPVLPSQTKSGQPSHALFVSPSKTKIKLNNTAFSDFTTHNTFGKTMTGSPPPPVFRAVQKKKLPALTVGASVKLSPPPGVQTAEEADCAFVRNEDLVPPSKEELTTESSQVPKKRQRQYGSVPTGKDGALKGSTVS